jgi:hypothetical protein
MRSEKHTVTLWRGLGRLMLRGLIKLALLAVAVAAFAWVLMVVLNPWALHIGGRSTPLLYWHGTGTVEAEGGTRYPLYVLFYPGSPAGISGAGRRAGKSKSADLSGTGWLCVAPGTTERMQLSGAMFGGYASDADSLIEFRLLEWRKPYAITPPHRGFFDLAGSWHGSDLVMDRPRQQGIRFASGLFIDHATVTFHWAAYEEFEAACGSATRPRATRR